MITLDAQATDAALPWPELINELRKGFCDGCEVPLRHHHDFSIPDESDGALLLMPAWIPGCFLGVKTVMVVPGNGVRHLPAVVASYQLIDGKTGQQLAMFDGGVLTNRRTAAASALASAYLSNTTSSHLLMVGTGALSHTLVEAHKTVRPITRVSVWGRSASKSKALVRSLQDKGVNAVAVDDLEKAAKSADIISCATMSKEPLIRGHWLKPGSHLDLVGAFKPDMRESDDEVLRVASVFVDTKAGAFKEAGDIVQPIADGAIQKKDVCADLFDLCQERHLGRSSSEERTVFKSVGTALEDLYAAILAYQTATKVSRLIN